MSTSYIAIDLGAESGRVVAVLLDRDAATFETYEAYRFAIHTVRMPTGLHWDIGSIWREIMHGMMLVAGWASENDHVVCSVGVDSWGVDWGLIDDHGELLGLPHAYRDERNSRAFDKFTEKTSVNEIYRLTGIQVMPINSLFSLFAMSSHSPDAVEAADHMLFMPDLFHYLMTNQRTNEATISSTSQLIDIRTGTWADQLLESCDVPRGIFSDPILPGTTIGSLRKWVQRETGLGPDVQVTAPASHDTAAAIAAIPAKPDSSWCFISSGTWSLVGAEIAQPCANEAAERGNFTNELGVAGTTRFLKNIAGLWLVQQCRRGFANRDQSYSYDELTDVARMAEPFRTLIDPDHPPFAAPGKMLDKIAEFAQKSEQPVPETTGDYLRCCLESLALAYVDTIEMVQKILNCKFDAIHVVGGGGKNDLLNQMTADASGIPVIAGPYEATAIGNGLTQAMGQGSIKDLAHLRQCVANSVSVKTFAPSMDLDWTGQWKQARNTFSKIKSRATVRNS